MISGIYAIRHAASGRVYIGSTRNFVKRWELHRWHLDQGTHHCSYLQRCWTKHGTNAFAWVVLEPTNDLLSREQFWIEYFDALNSATGFNLKPAMRRDLGPLANAEYRARLSAALKGKPKSPEARKKLSLARMGTKASLETRAKISAALTGKKRSESFRQQLSLRSTGVVPSAETREKLRAAHIGTKASSATRAKMSASHKGKKHPPSASANHRAANLRRPPPSLETRAKISMTKRRSSARH